jgi:antitoxin component YwqK of YwqJK toxin-antitoxin module
MKRIITVLSCFLMMYLVQAQKNEINPNGYNVFYYENGQISSEGYMKDGKPDGYWKTYFENGILKSEGNRRDFLLDSIWKFYDEKGKLVVEITYLNDKKNGIRRTIQENETIEEHFVDDIKQGPTLYYYPDGKKKKMVPFVNGLEDGTAYEYDDEGTVITLITYKKGYIVNRDKINRKDRNNLKQGKWMYFYENGVVRLEGTYKDDKKNGYFKEYDRKGNLIKTEKYLEDVIQEDVAELVELEIRTDYYPSGNIKTVASYKDGVPEGVRREYSEDGRILATYVFDEGVITGQGIMNEQGIRTGPWKELYPDGKTKAEGMYKDGKKTGRWKYYYPDGTIEQEGAYDDDGNLTGEWKWYYNSGKLMRQESYLNGLLDGFSVEYDESGLLVSQGEYIEGLENGFWEYHDGETFEEGTYLNGLRNGEWKSYYAAGQLRFKGEFIDDNPNGRHLSYWDNGNVKEEGRYIMGRKEGDWIKYNDDGTLFLVISYEGGIETKYDGIRIKPDFTEDGPNQEK